MALTSTEEALVRQLLDQQAAILSLAGNEATITSKLGATKVTLSDLVAASSVADADLLLMRQGTNDKSATPLLLRAYMQDGLATVKGVQAGDYNTCQAGGTANAITGDYTPNPAALEDGLTLFVRASTANTTTTPTFSPDGLTAKTIVKGNNLPLAVSDIAGAGHWLELQYDAPLDKWVLQNPAKGIITVDSLPVGSIIEFSGTSAPAGFLVCPTAATNVSRTTYAALFTAIGTTWGAGDGSTTFGIPWFPADYTAVQANGNVGTQTVGQVIAHSHSIQTFGGSSGTYASGTLGLFSNTGSTGGSANLAAGSRVLRCVKF